MGNQSGIQSKTDIRGVGVIATGTAFPDTHGRWIHNNDIHHLKYGPEWRSILRDKNHDPDHPRIKFGFERRFWVHTPGDDLERTKTTSADLIEIAIRNALDDSGIPEDQIDLLIAFTTTSPRYTSSIATILAGRLGLKCAAFEIKAGCSSAIHALSIAYQFMAAGAQYAIIAGGDTLTKVTDLKSSHLFAAGDGAGALILGRVAERGRGLDALYLDADGSHSESMGVPGILPPIRAALDHGDYILKITGGSESTIQTMWRRVPERLFQISGADSRSIQLFLPHQVNRELIEIGSDAAGIDRLRVADYVADYGNCGPAGILVAMDRSFRENRIKPLDRVMLCAVGGGLAWGGLILNV